MADIVLALRHPRYATLADNSDKYYIVGMYAFVCKVGLGVGRHCRTEMHYDIIP